MKRKKAELGVPNLLRSWQADVGEFVRVLAADRSGRLLAVATAAAPIALLDSETGAIRQTLPGHEGGVTALSWHQDGKLLASTGHDGHVRVWNPATGASRWAADAGSAWVERCAFSRDGRLLAVAAGRVVRLYDATGRLVRELTGHPSTVADLAWRPDRNELVVARYGGIHVWDPGREQPVQTLNYRGSVLRIAVSPTGNFVATADQNSTVHFWRTRDWQDAEMSGYPHLVTSLSWDSTGRYLGTDGGADGFVWDCSDPGPNGRMPAFLKSDPDFLTRCLAFAPDRPVCATAGESGSVAVYDVTKPNRVEVDRVGGAVSVLVWVTGKQALIAGTVAGVVVAYGEPPLGKA